MKLIGSTFLALFCLSIFTSRVFAGWEFPYQYRVKINLTTQTNGLVTIEYPIDLKHQLGSEGIVANQLNLKLVEISSSGNILDSQVPFQYDLNEKTLIFSPKSNTQLTRTFYLYLDTNKDNLYSPSTPVRMDETTVAGQDSFVFSTPNGEYSYHKRGAAFASLKDNRGKDWLSYNLATGAKGEYRGLPNMGYPEGYMHPGETNSNSQVTITGPVHYRINSTSNDGKWAGFWDIFPTHARFTLTKISHDYWFLYEGTPGGTFNLDDTITRSSGQTTKLSQSWDGDITGNTAGEWILVDSKSSNQSLLLLHHTNDDQMDSYYQMQQSMTVFGFGRKGLNKYMTRVPDTFSISFISDATNPSSQISNALQQPEIKSDKLETFDDTNDLNNDRVINIFDITSVMNKFTTTCSKSSSKCHFDWPYLTIFQF